MTKLDQDFAKSVREGVNALILEVERLETVGLRYELALKAILDKSKDNLIAAIAQEALTPGFILTHSGSEDKNDKG